jgi:subtilisin
MCRFLHPLSYFICMIIIIGACSEHSLQSDENYVDINKSNEVIIWQDRLEMILAEKEANDKITRWDTPWWEMSDEELADSISTRGNKVFISFKESGMNAGVDEFGKVLVTNSTIENGIRQIKSMGIEVLHQYKLTPYVFAKINPSKRIIRELRDNPIIDVIEPLGRRKIHSSNNYAWNYESVNAPPAWDYATGNNVKVLVIDAFVDENHPDLNVNIVSTCSPNEPPTNPFIPINHGTQVAGIIAGSGNNISNVKGVSHDVDLYFCKGGENGLDDKVIKEGIEYARSNNIFVINMSFGGFSPSSAFHDAILGAYHQDGMVLVASTGNVSSSVSYPASAEEVIAVSGTDINDEFWSSSNTGPEVEIAAPASQVETLCYDSYSSSCTPSNAGTSFSAPHVSGAAALLKSFNSNWSNEDIRNQISENAQSINATEEEVGSGLLDVEAALGIEELQISISGRVFVTNGVEGTWTANASGGVTPYSYKWFKNIYDPPFFIQVGTGESYSEVVTECFDLKVEVTDAFNETETSDIFNITTNPGC